MTVARFLKVTFLLFLVTGCSRVQLAYSQLDWLIPYYLGTYVTLTDAQKPVLDEKVDALLTWHCGTQLATYAAMMRSANADFQSGAMTRERLRDYTAQLEGHWRAIMKQASPAVADLLLTASDEQIEGLFEVFKEKNETWLADYRDQTAEERREEYEDRMTEELERWFGPLGPEQQAAVSAWSRSLTPLGLEGLESRQRWQATLRAAIAKRADEPAFRAAIEEVFVNPRAFRLPAIQKRFDENRALALDLVFEVGRHLDAAQRKHLDGEAESFARDLDDLVCVPGAPRAARKNAEKPDRPVGVEGRRDP